MNKCEEYTSSIRRRESNPRHLERESLPITTRPGLLSNAAQMSQKDLLRENAQSRSLSLPDDLSIIFTSFFSKSEVNNLIFVATSLADKVPIR